MKRREKRELASYHDSRRWLKGHQPHRGDPLVGLRNKAVWREPVGRAVANYPKWAARQKADMAAGGILPRRRGPSAESVVIWNFTGPVAAVETALGRFSRPEQARLKAVLWGGAPRDKIDRSMLGLFYRYVAVYLGYGRPRYDRKST